MPRLSTGTADQLPRTVDTNRGDHRTPDAARAVLSAMFLVSLTVFASGRVAQVPYLALGGALGILFFGIGTAPVQLSPRTGLWTRLGTAGLVGLSTALLIGEVMVLGPLWHPDIAALLVLTAACAVHALALPSSMADLRLVATERRPHARLVRIAGSPSLLCTLAGTALWLGSAIFSRPIVPGSGGFLPHITPLWYVGLVLVLAGIVLARRERHEAYAAIAVIALALALTVTPALLYGMPRSQSAAKHIELVRFILRTHHLNASDGIYAAYSAFFSAVAWICRVAGVADPVGLATFWPMLMVLLEVAGLRFMFGRVIDGGFRRWAAVALVLLVNAIGAEYFSPQSVGFVLGLGVFGLVLGERRDIDRRLAVAMLLAASAALATTHELSPYIVGGVLVVLCTFRCARPRWAAVPILGAAGAWALVNHHVLGGYFSLSSLGSISNFTPPSVSTAPGLGREAIVGASSDALLIGLLALSAAALVGLARLRRTRAAWAYIISAGVGLVFVAVNSYGNEGIFRAALFGIPWLALLAVQGWSIPKARVAAIALMATFTVLLATFLVASFGMDGTSVMRRADLQALRVFEQDAPRRSYLLNVGPGDLPSIPPSSGSSTEVSYYNINDSAWQRPGRPQPSDLYALLQRYEQAAGGASAAQTGRLFVLSSPVLSEYAQAYGLDRPSQSARWLDLLLASRSWQVVYADDGTYLFQATAPATAAGATPPRTARGATP